MFKIPESLSFDEASTWAAAFQAASFCLDKALGLPEPYEAPAANGIPILGWGGSSSVGMNVIQLVKLSGCTVVVTASPNNVELLTVLGADHVLSYNDSDVSLQIQKITDNKLCLAIDTISTIKTTQNVIDALASSTASMHTKRTVVTLQPVPKEELSEKAQTVDFHFSFIGSLWRKAFTLLGQDIPANPTNCSFPQLSFLLLEKLLTDNKLKQQKIKIFGGLDNVQSGFEYMKSGKLSTEKIVYRPGETKYPSHSPTPGFHT